MSWHNAEVDEKAEILHSIDQSNQAKGEAFYLSFDHCTVQTLDLLFYPKTKLLKLSGTKLPNSPKWYVRMPHTIINLANDISIIHHCNSEAPLMLNDSTIYDYIKFRYYFSDSSRVFELKIKHSAVGYSGKIWMFKDEVMTEMDINISPRGNVTELEKNVLEGVPDITDGDFVL